MMNLLRFEDCKCGFNGVVEYEYARVDSWTCPDCGMDYEDDPMDPDELAEQMEGLEDE